MRFWPLLLLPALAACDATSGDPLEDPDPLVLMGHTTWGPERVRLGRDLIVRGTLELLPGTTVEVIRGAEVTRDPAGDFYREPVIHVEGGRLLAVGTEEAPVRFVLTGASPYGGDGGLVSVEIDTRDAPAPSHLAWVNLGGYLRWEGGPVNVSNTTLLSLNLGHPDSLAVTSSEVELLHILAHESTGPALRYGLVEDNRIGYLSVVGDEAGRLTVRRNTIASDVSCGLFSHGATSRVERNAFERCATGLELRGTGTVPRLSENNFTGQKRTLVLQPWTSEVDTGTVDARNNWWGTTGLEAIRSRIVYEPNGGNVSGREVLIEPVATGPFDL